METLARLFGLTHTPDKKSEATPKKPAQEEPAHPAACSVSPAAPESRRLFPTAPTKLLHVGIPKDIDHRVHVTRDETDGSGYSGLPPEWLARLKESGLTGEQISSEPHAVIAALKQEFSTLHTKVQKRASRGIEDEEPILAKEDSEDPKKHYVNMTNTPPICRAFCIETCQDVAIKRIPVASFEDLTYVKAELQLYISLHCHAIVHFIRCHYYGGEVWIVMELMELGSLEGYLEKGVTPFDEDAIAFIMGRVLMALEYMHTSGLIHRDVKSDNVCVSAQGEVKLADFGVSCNVTDVGDEMVGTHHWWAPEVVSRSSYGTPADIWSAGILMLELLHGEPPYYDEDLLVVMFAIQTRPPPSVDSSLNTSPELRHFLSQLLVKDPSGRGKAKELLQHPFLRKGKEYDASKLVDALRKASTNVFS